MQLACKQQQQQQQQAQAGANYGWQQQPVADYGWQQQQQQENGAEGADPLDEEILEMVLLASFTEALQQQQQHQHQPMQLVQFEQHPGTIG
jgi:hypothetical protein